MTPRNEKVRRLATLILLRRLAEQGKGWRWALVNGKAVLRWSVEGLKPQYRYHVKPLEVVA